MTNLDSFDPNWEFAAIHGKANKLGYKKNHSTQRNLCPCCLNFIQKQPIPICEHTKELEIFGFGIPLYYVFLRSCILLLFVLICSYNAISLYFAITHNQNFCSEHQHDHSYEFRCQSWMVLLARTESSKQQTEIVLRITFFCLQLGLLVYIREMIMKLCSYYDQRTTTLSDYAVKIKRIPPQKGLGGKFKQFFAKQFTKEHKIKQITFLPVYDDILKLQKQKHHVIERLRPYYKDNETISGNLEERANIQNQRDLIQNQIQKRLHQLVEEGKADQMVCEGAILIFNTDEEKEEIIHQFSLINANVKAQYFGEGSQQMELYQAPQPKQIIWENTFISKKKSILLKLTGWGLSLIVLAVVTVVFYFIMNAKTELVEETVHHYHDDPSKYEGDLAGAIALVYVMLFLVILFNKLGMVTLFHYFTHIESHKTSSSFQFSFGLKYCLGLFFTTALMTLLVQAISHQNYFKHPYGVVEEETVMFILNAVFVPLFWLINPFQLKTLIKRKINVGRKDLTQKEANQLMQDYEYDIGKRYAEVIQTLWFTFLYATMIPIGAVFSFFGIIFYYWIDKINFLRRSCLKVQVQGKLTNLAMKLLDFTLLFRQLGQLLFDTQMRKIDVHASTIVLICIAVVYLLLPMNSILQYLIHEKFNLQDKTYDQVKSNFVETYHTLHPTYYAGKKAHLREKIEKQGIHFWGPEIINTMKFLKETDGVEQDLQKDINFKKYDVI